MQTFIKCKFTGAIRLARAISLFVFFALAVTVGRAETNSPAQPKRPCDEKVNREKPLSGRSVYQLTSRWTTDGGKHIKLAELRGKPQVVAMIFTSCQGACPILVHQMREIEQALPEDARNNVGFLLVTFDVERDTPEVLHAYRTAQNLPTNQWTLLHGKSEDVRELAMALGVKYRKGATGQFSHSNLITILNAEGEIAFQQTGLGESSNDLTQKLLRLSKH